MNLRIRLTRVRWHLKRAVEILIDRTRLPVGVPSTADWHEQPSSTHPSLLCKCGDPSALADHRPDCLWLAAMCKPCGGTGWCNECGGDGVSQGEEASK